MNHSCVVPLLLLDGQWPNWTGSQAGSSLLISGQLSSGLLNAAPQWSRQSQPGTKRPAKVQSNLGCDPLG